MNLEKKIKNIKRRYRYHKIEDSAFTLFKEEETYIKKTFNRKNERDEYYNALERAYKRLEKNTLLGIFSKKSKRYKTYKLNHPDTSKQAYINEIENIKNFRNIADIMTEFSSEQISLLYTITSDSKEVERVAKETYEEFLEQQRTIDFLFDEIVTRLRKIK